MGTSGAGGGASGRGEARRQRAKAKIKVSSNVKVAGQPLVVAPVRTTLPPAVALLTLKPRSDQMRGDRILEQMRVRLTADLSVASSENRSGLHLA